ncbi:hypothetical protein M0R45_001273 [Rubus argutus]|uniref:DOMON domain-containing protein n=1 Tax=Rubus argutus TaxID=59490 RepID=A0AAW1VJJ8_RUBAR
MASFSPLLFLISLLALLFAKCRAIPCSSQTFKNNRRYDYCTDFPILHWTYNASNCSLSVAFLAAPSKPGGWVAWAINPNGTKMPGAQALVAHTVDDGTPTVNTYNVISYTSIVPGKLSFDVWDISAEFSYGFLIIFATVKVPEEVDTVNQIWQVGPGINQTTGLLQKHELLPMNLATYGFLSLVPTGTHNTRGDG